MEILKTEKTGICKVRTKYLLKTGQEYTLLNNMGFCMLFDHKNKLAGDGTEGELVNLMRELEACIEG